MPHRACAPSSIKPYDGWLWRWRGKQVAEVETGRHSPGTPGDAGRLLGDEVDRALEIERRVM
jgi:hypothetical protein